MEEITVSRAQELSSPNPFVLVTAMDAEGAVNIAAFSWWTFLSNTPPALAFCAKKGRYTGECVKRSGYFTVCLADEALKEKAFKCGTVSGKNVNKSEAFGIALIQCRADGLMAVRDSKIIFVCRLRELIPVGDHELFVGEIEKALGAPEKRQLYAYDGYKRLDI